MSIPKAHPEIIIIYVISLWLEPKLVIKLLLNSCLKKNCAIIIL